MPQPPQNDTKTTIYKVVVAILTLLLGWIGAQVYQSSLQVALLHEALAVEKELRLLHIKDYTILNERNRDLSERMRVLEDRHESPRQPHMP